MLEYSKITLAGERLVDDVIDLNKRKAERAALELSKSRLTIRTVPADSVIDAALADVVKKTFGQPVVGIFATTARVLAIGESLGHYERKPNAATVQKFMARLQEMNDEQLDCFVRSFQKEGVSVRLSFWHAMFRVVITRAYERSGKKFPAPAAPTT